MQLLLDTHTFLWWIDDDPRLSVTARSLIANSHNDLLLSAASGWEMAIKVRLGKLRLPDDASVYIAEQMLENNIRSLAIEMSHALHTPALPLHHRDPFDRLLVAQCQLESLDIVTADPLISQYDVNAIW